MRIILWLFFCLCIQFATAQRHKVEVFSKNDGEIVRIYASSDEVIPYTIRLNLNLENMKPTEGGRNQLHVIQPKTQNMLLNTIVPASRTGVISVDMEYEFLPGDYGLKIDKNHIYEMPFDVGKTVYISQGYNGKYSHQGVNALDFKMDIGDNVYAARAGVVMRTIAHHFGSCSSPSCAHKSNLIRIYHSDGTWAEYSHLKQYGVKVDEGDFVNAGQLIAESGNTGQTTGPHLHFAVFRAVENKRPISVKTLFDTKKGTIFLEGKQRYTKPY